MISILLVLSFLLSVARADESAGTQDPLKLSWGAFVDSYYNYDFNSPTGSDRSLANGAPFGTSAIRSNEFNINLAYVEVKAVSDRVRGRLALQGGTSVQANYAGESTGLGVVKGAVPAELLQEAVAGYRIADGFWVDGGIYFSHIGLETFISRDNWNYTRSILAENSPYYQSGVRFSYEFSPVWSAQLHILNGWQNIYNVDQNKALGLELAFNPAGKISFVYNDLFFNEPGSLTRTYHDFITKYLYSDRLQFAASVDFGSQVRPGGGGTSYWWGSEFMGRYQLTSKLIANARVESFVDKDQVIIQTAPASGFAAGGGSVGLDVQLHKNLVWRNEARLISASDSTFGSSNGAVASDKFLVTSFGLTLQ